MMWKGAWRPVLHMLDGGNTPTTLPVRATKAVLYIAHRHLVAVPVGPADILENADYRTSAWETSNDDDDDDDDDTDH